MIAPVSCLVEDSIFEAFGPWVQDEERVLIYDQSLVPVMTPCENPEGCEGADLVQGEDGEDVWVHSTTALRVTLTANYLGSGQPDRSVTFVMGMTQVLDGSMEELLVDIRTEFEFDFATGALSDTEQRMQKIVAEYQQG